MGIKLKVWGDYACFTRPEMKAERYSYDVITPSAARGILDAIYWKPQFKWEITRIHVMKEPQFISMGTNEVKFGLNPFDPKPFYIQEKGVRACRTTTLLRDVEYYIEAYVVSDNPKKHYEIFNNRASIGGFYHRPCFGSRQYFANFDLVDFIPKAPESFSGKRNLGRMFYGFDYAPVGVDAPPVPKFFHAIMEDGVINVPPFNSL